MSTSYAHFTTLEREKLLQFIAQGLKQIEIARALGRSRSSVSRELNATAGKTAATAPLRLRRSTASGGSAVCTGGVWRILR